MRKLLAIILLSIFLCGCACLKDLLKFGNWADYYGKEIEYVFEDLGLDINDFKESRIDIKRSKMIEYGAFDLKEFEYVGVKVDSWTMYFFERKFYKIKYGAKGFENFKKWHDTFCYNSGKYAETEDYCYNFSVWAELYYYKEYDEAVLSFTHEGLEKKAKEWKRKDRERQESRKQSGKKRRLPSLLGN